jgi:glycosyltransferase involved in cell wall biosynthesis
MITQGFPSAAPIGAPEQVQELKVIAKSKPKTWPTTPSPFMPAYASTLPTKKLNIAIVAAPFIPVPPKGYGGLERVVYDLAVPLAQMGHKVTVFGADESNVEGCNVVRYGPAIGTVKCDWLQEERKAFDRVASQLAGFDIIHTNDWFGMAYKLRAANSSIKVCHTHHGGLNTEWWGTSKPPFPLNLFSISRFMADVYRQQGLTARPIYNGVSLEKYAYQERKGDRLIFVGRADTFKQPHVAVEVAKRLNVALDLVCGTFVYGEQYMASVKAMCDGTQIRWIEDPPQDEKVRLIQNAKCLLFPSRMMEPFGLVAAEANCCGTPAIGFDDGAIPEVIADGVTGFVVHDYTRMAPDQWEKLPDTEKQRLFDQSVNGMCDAVRKVNAISPQSCRARVEQLFSRETMAKNYLQAYEDIIAGREW